MNTVGLLCALNYSLDERKKLIGLSDKIYLVSREKSVLYLAITDQSNCTRQVRMGCPLHRLVTFYACSSHQTIILTFNYHQPVEEPTTSPKSPSTPTAQPAMKPTWSAKPNSPQLKPKTVDEPPHLHYRRNHGNLQTTHPCNAQMPVRSHTLRETM